MNLQDIDVDGLITLRDLNSAANASFVSDINKNGRIDAGDLLNDARWENGIDEDGNAYKDDLIGWDFVSNDNDPYDDNGHGTHTAGTIGAMGGNGLGVAGVNWNAQIMGLKFLSSSGSGSTAGAIRALDYYTAAAALDQTRGWNSQFIGTNNSWGGGGFSQSMLDSIVRSGRQNTLFIAAAGNGGSDGVSDNNDAVANYPSNYSTLSAIGYESVIAVAALTSSGTIASYSNYGSTTVDLGAPGSGVWSTVPGGGYASYSGTSMATPHVTGALALYASQNPNATAAQLRAALLSTTASTTSLTNKTVTGGRLDVGALMNGSDGNPPPPAPTPSGVSLYGTTKNDNLSGTAYADLLSGIPVSGTNLGARTVDTLTGLQGNDLFILGDARGRFYDDGKSTSAGLSDYALITDFVAGIDKIQLKGGNYFLAATTVSGASGTGIFFDSNGNGSFGNRDELVGLLKGVAVSAVSSSDFSWA
jgi:subtilisin family serine protease